MKTILLPNIRTTRVAFSIQKNPDSGLHGGITFLDRGGSNNSIPLTSVTVAASGVTITQTAANIPVAAAV